MDAVTRTTIAACLVFFCSGCTTSEPMREANAFETSYNTIAVTRRDPSLCYRIAPDAYIGAGNDPRGLQIEYVRSRCLYEVAAFRRDPTLCDEVRSLSTFFLDGSLINAEACRAAATTSPAPSYGIGGGQVELFVRLLGYLDSDASASLDEIVESYNAKVRTGEFGQRMKRLPDFSQGDAVARAQIDELAPHCWVGSKDRLCKILECAVTRDRQERARCYTNLDPPTF